MEPLKFGTRELVFFALNDNQDSSVPIGGSHWSLLVWSRNEGVLRHYDSLNGANLNVAEKLMEVLQAHLPPNAKLESMACPRQANTYDCGMVVLAVAQALCERHLVRRTTPEHPAIMWDVGTMVTGPKRLQALRAEIHELILQKSNGQNSAKKPKCTS